MVEHLISTTFCPQIALRNAEFNGKAYDENEINIFILKITNAQTKVFSFNFKQKGTNFSHEKEILFASKANIKIIQKTKIIENKKVSKYDKETCKNLEKTVPAYITEVEIS